MYPYIESTSIADELQAVQKELAEVKTENSLNYIFITDTHIDTKQSQNNEKLILNTLKYARLMAENNDDIDLIVLGGDYPTGWYDKARCLANIRKLSAALEGCAKPVIMLRGNHDNNTSGNPVSKADPTQIASEEEIFNCTQSFFLNDKFIYDKSVKNGLYFYYDVPEKKTRVVAWDSSSSDPATQIKWLADEVLTVPDEGWQYVFLMHIQIDSRYHTSDSLGSANAAGSEEMKILFRALNNRTTASGSFGTKDFSHFKSRVVSFSFGHMHNSYMEYNSELGVFCSLTGCTGCVGRTDFHFVQADDHAISRYRLENSDKNRYLFDIFSVNQERMARIRFGTGDNKIVYSNQ